MNKQLVHKQTTCSQTNNLLTNKQLVHKLPLKKSVTCSGKTVPNVSKFRTALIKHNSSGLSSSQAEIHKIVLFLWHKNREMAKQKELPSRRRQKVSNVHYLNMRKHFFSSELWYEGKMGCSISILFLWKSKKVKNLGMKRISTIHGSLLQDIG